LRRLVAQGNSVIMVEHDPWFIKAADLVVEFGPGAGEKGGEILFLGPPEALAQNDSLPTGAFLSGKRRLSRRKRAGKSKVCLSPADLPTNCLVTICGPSGAGKTRLLREIEEALLSRGLSVEFVRPAEGKGQKAIPVSYVGAFTPLRELFAKLPEARMRGLRPAHFSFFSKEGRCPGCRGEGFKEIKVSLMTPLRVVCEECGGTRYRRDVLEVRYRGFHIAEVLNLTVKEGLSLFSRVPAISERLRLLAEVGLGYLCLGQPLATLSGGERQRLRLARILTKGEKRAFLLFDVPTLGLHLADVERLLALFDCFLSAGHTIVVADNHPALVLLADHLLEVHEGKVVFSGHPEEWLSRGGDFAQRFEYYRSLVA